MTPPLCSCGCPEAETEDLYVRRSEGYVETIEHPAVHTHPDCHVIHRGRSCPVEPGLFEEQRTTTP